MSMWTMVATLVTASPAFAADGDEAACEGLAEGDDCTREDGDPGLCQPDDSDPNVLKCDDDGLAGGGGDDSGSSSCSQAGAGAISGAALLLGGLGLVRRRRHST